MKPGAAACCEIGRLRTKITIDGTRIDHIIDGIKDLYGNSLTEVTEITALTCREVQS